VQDFEIRRWKIQRPDYLQNSAYSSTIDEFGQQIQKYGLQKKGE